MKLFKNAVFGFTIADETFEYNYHTKTSDSQFTLIAHFNKNATEVGVTADVCVMRQYIIMITTITV